MTKNYVTGVWYNGSFESKQCILDIIEKQPAELFDNYEHQGENICNLLHMDSSGPFPMRFANGNSSHFYSILDDYSNFRSTALLSKKNTAAKHF